MSVTGRDDPRGVRALFSHPLGRRGLAAALTRADAALLACGVAVYAAMRLVGLTRFPIYFFCDEAMQTNLAVDLLRGGLHDDTGVFLPPYFQNVDRWNLSLSVYVQALSTWLFGSSVFVNRATSVAVTLLAAVAVALMLRLCFRLRTWWAGPLVLSVLPVWFLHSRTSFETAMMVAFYACFLCAYLLYRSHDPRYVIATLVFGAATFYSYANGQGVMFVSAVLLLACDLPYHQRTFRARPRLLAAALITAGLVAVQYVRFHLLHPNAVTEHLEVMQSVWTRDVSLGEKLQLFGTNYLQGLSPWFWFAPANGVDLDRHLVKGWGNIPLVFLPLIAIGLVLCLRRWRSPAHRVVLVAILAAPFSAAFVVVHNYRALAMVVPAAMLVCLGLEQVVGWLSARMPQWRARPLLGAACAVLLLTMNGALLRAALTDGPTWYTNYGLFGMQYGATQLFTTIRGDLQAAPGTEFIVSPDWANFPDAFVPFFLPEDQQSRVRFLSPEQYVKRKHEWRPEAIFVLPADQYSAVSGDPKFVVDPPVRVLTYPDGRPGFYFARMRYVPDVDAIFAAEREARAVLVEETTELDGRTVRISHSRTDSGTVANLFDTDKATLLRGYEANPFVLDLAFSEPREIKGIGLDLYHVELGLTVSVWPADGDVAQTFTAEYRDLPRNDPHVDFDLPSGPLRARRIRLELLKLPGDLVTKIHVETLTLR